MLIVSTHVQTITQFLELSGGACSKNGEVRLCIDYRRLNVVTERDGYPLPRIEDSLGRLSGAKYFSSLDLESSFWQMAMAEEHREKTAFVTPDGLFEFLRLPFGLCGWPPSFQRPSPTWA